MMDVIICIGALSALGNFLLQSTWFYVSEKRLKEEGKQNGKKETIEKTNQET